MKKTTDPLKTVAKNTAAADATKVNVNVPKTPINVRAKISDIPNRFLEKQNEQVDMMKQRGYEPIYKTDAKGNKTLEAYAPKGKAYGKEEQKKYQNEVAKQKEASKPGALVRTTKYGTKIYTAGK